MTLIIDWHGHYTTALPAHNEWREAQISAFNAGSSASLYPSLTDDQTRLLRERGIDLINN